MEDESRLNTAEIIVIGDELLSGETVDTNSNYLDCEFETLGWSVSRHTTVPDDIARISEAITDASRRADAVICSGGLGPTQDDLTLEALARALGCELRQDEAVLTSIEEKFAKIGRSMTPNNARQSFVPEQGEVIDNPVGTAPSFTAKLNRAQVFLLPGVPRELKWLFDHEIKTRLSVSDRKIHRRTLKVIGFGESRLEHTIREVVKNHRQNVTFGYRALGIENHIKLMAKGSRAVASLAAAESDLRKALGHRIFGSDDDKLVEIVTSYLNEHGQTVATAESCTGGLIAKTFTDVAGSSQFFVGSCIAYSNEVKTEVLRVGKETLEQHGAVSENVAAEMAEGAKKLFGTTWAISTTGIAGPGGAVDGKPVGTVCIGIAGPAGTETLRRHILGDRSGVRWNTTLLALERLREKLI
ncbi:MAG: competence/damage-inducible protein A [Myxococcota bacterium]|nr:competence/damage-inducible protein A [Myxococcota bacterium]